MVDSSRYIALRLQKEKQDEDQQLAKQALQQRQMQMILSTGMDAAQGIAGAMKTSKQNGVANALMNQQTPPRAEAVDPALNAQMRQQGLGPTAPRTGGVDELKLSMAMEDQRNQNMASALSVAREGRLNHALNDAAVARQTQDATQTARMTNQATKDKVTASAAYFKNKALLEKSMSAAQAAGDFDAYNSTAQDLQALHYGTVSSGVKLPDLMIPDFRSPTAPTPEAMTSAVSDWQGRRDRAMKPGGWDSNGDWFNGKTAGDEFMDSSSNLSELQSQSRGKPVDKFTPDQEDVIPLPQSSGGGGGLIAQAKQAIAAGADPAAVAERIKALGLDPSLLNQ